MTFQIRININDLISSLGYENCQQKKLLRDLQQENAYLKKQLIALKQKNPVIQSSAAKIEITKEQCWEINRQKKRDEIIIDSPLQSSVYYSRQSESNERESRKDPKYHQKYESLRQLFENKYISLDELKSFIECREKKKNQQELSDSELFDYSKQHDDQEEEKNNPQEKPEQLLQQSQQSLQSQQPQQSQQQQQQQQQQEQQQQQQQQQSSLSSSSSQEQQLQQEQQLDKQIDDKQTEFGSQPSSLIKPDKAIKQKLYCYCNICNKKYQSQARLSKHYNKKHYNEVTQSISFAIPQQQFTSGCEFLNLDY